MINMEIANIMVGILLIVIFLSGLAFALFIAAMAHMFLNDEL